MILKTANPLKADGRSAVCFFLLFFVTMNKNEPEIFT